MIKFISIWLKGGFKSLEFVILGKRIIAIEEKIDSITKSGICLQSSESNLKRAKVICVNVDLIKDILVGETILYEEHSAIKFRLEDKDYIILEYDDILTKIKE